MSLHKYLLVLMIALAQNSFSWTMQMDCENGTANQLPPASAGVTWGTLSTISSSTSFSGTKSCQFAIKQGREGWPSSGGALEWGSIYSFPEKVSVGQELWLRLALYLPESFPISSNTGALKFIRLKTRVADTSRNTGCLDFLMGDSRIAIWDPLLKKDVRPPFIVNFEGAPNLMSVGQRPVHEPRKGVWETYEIYVKVDNVPVKKGGQGLMKIWKNNQLVATLDNQVLVADATGYMDAFFLFTYWNGNAPSDAHALMDDLIITTETPQNVDASGFPYIGGEISLVPPKSPLNPKYL